MERTLGGLKGSTHTHIHSHSYIYTYVLYLDVCPCLPCINTFQLNAMLLASILRISSSRQRRNRLSIVDSIRYANSIQSGIINCRKLRRQFRLASLVSFAPAKPPPQAIVGQLGDAQTAQGTTCGSLIHTIYIFI